MTVDWRWVVSSVVLGIMVGACGMDQLRIASVRVLKGELERSVTERDARIERLTSQQDILTEDVRSCREDLERERAQFEERYEESYQCFQSLVYCRKVCGEKDKP